jgi:hypothetical protein
MTNSAADEASDYNTGRPCRPWRAGCGARRCMRADAREAVGVFARAHV